MKILILLLFVSFDATAQYYRSDEGKPIKTIPINELIGSPFFWDEWSSGSVILAQGNKKIEGLQLRYNLLYKELEVLLDGTPRVFPELVHEFTLSKSDSFAKQTKVLFRNGFNPIDGNNALSFYMVVYDGKMKLLKSLKQKMDKPNPYANGNTSMQIITSEDYYLELNTGEMQKFKKDKKYILDLLSDKKEPIDRYIKKNKIRFNSDDDLSNLLGYFESL